MYQTESLENIMPFAHGANAIELQDGRMFVTWYCGSYEGGEDQRIAGAIRNPDGTWNSTKVVVGRFEFDGDTWIPEIGVPVEGPSGEIRLYFWANALSTYSLISNPCRIRWDCHATGWGPASWIPIATVLYEKPVFKRDIASSRSFSSVLGPDLIAGNAEVFWDERGLVLMGAARKLQSERWLMPYHTQREDTWFHSRFFISDQNQENWETRGDISAEAGCLEPVAVQLPSGDVLCYMRRGGFHGHIWRAVSSDEGRTFSGPEQTNLRGANAGIDIGLSRVSDRLLIVYNDSYTERVPLSVGISSDEGQTWRVRDVETQIGSYAYPKLMQTHDGIWHLFYSHDYCHIQHAWFDEDWLEEGRRVLG